MTAPALSRDHVQPGRRVVDPSQVRLQAVEGVVGEQHVEGAALPLELGELAHPLQVRRPLDVQVVVGRLAEHEREHDLGEQLALQVRLRRRGLGEPLLHVGDALVGDDVPAPFRPGPLLDGPGHGLPVPGQPRQRGIHLAVAQRPPLPEVGVVVALQVIPMAGPALKQPQQRQRNTHT
jgi:hypothetical protein